jgi:CheY-like chemotaxis protein
MGVKPGIRWRNIAITLVHGIVSAIARFRRLSPLSRGVRFLTCFSERRHSGLATSGERIRVLKCGRFPMRPVRVLVVDDYEPWREHVCSVLKTRPELKVVGEASDGLEAVRIAEELKPDLILLDIGLPHLNGIDVAHQLCQTVPGAKILFLTQNNDAGLVQAVLSNGVQGYVLKAGAGSDLLPAIKAVLQGEKFVSSGIRDDFRDTEDT